MTMSFCMRFDVPAALHEFDGQPVEQFRMHRPFALRAEIVHRLDDAEAEVGLPEAVHGDAGGERIRRDPEPPRQIRGDCAGRAAGKRLGNAGDTFSPGAS